MRQILTCSLSVLLVSCAAVNPYVTPGNLGSEGKELKYATDRRADVDDKRQELVKESTLSGAALISDAALVAYKGARATHAVNVSALAAGGLAGYAVSQYLIQTSRLKVYTEASKQMTCAINEYRTTFALVEDTRQGALTVLGKSKDLAAFSAGLRSEITEKLGNDPDGQRLQGRVVVVAQWLVEVDRTVAPLANMTTASGAGLVGAIDRICEELAQQIDGTVPTLASIGSSLDSLSQFGPPKTPPPAPKAVGIAGGAGAPALRSNAKDGKEKKEHDDMVDALEKQVAGLESSANDLYATALQLISTSTTSSNATPNYDKCTMADLKATAATPQIPLQLGPNNSSNNGTFSVPVSKPLEIYITGGAPKYAAALSNPPDTGAPKAELIASGDATLILRVTMSADTPKATKFVVVVSDGTGAHRQITVQLAP